MYQFAGFDYSNVPNVIIPSANYNPLKQLNNYQAGVILGFFKNFSITYNYQNTYTASLAEVKTVDAPFILFNYVNYYVNESINRIGLNYNLTSKNLTWRTALNISDVELNIAHDPNFAAYYSAGYLSKGHQYSGGFTNRFEHKTIFAGLDLLYRLGERPIGLINVTQTTPISQPHINSLSLQSLYAAY